MNHIQYIILSIIGSISLLAYILALYRSIKAEEQQPKKQPKKEKNNIIFNYNGTIYKYKDNKAFYKSLQHIEETKFFVKSIDEKERVAEFIQLYYPNSKIYKIEL